MKENLAQAVMLMEMAIDDELPECGVTKDEMICAAHSLVQSVLLDLMGVTQEVDGFTRAALETIRVASDGEMPVMPRQSLRVQ